MQRFAFAITVCALAACGGAERPASLPVQQFDVVIARSDSPPVAMEASIDAGVAPSADVTDVTDVTPTQRDVSSDLDPSRPYPNGPYGGGLGNVPPPFTLPDCMGAPYAYAGPMFQQSRATVLALFTGTCATCEADARMLQTLAMETAARRVRVVAVLLEGGAPMEQPDAVFCAGWRARSGATHPILLDVSRTLDTINPVPRAFPLVLVSDGAGIIRGRFAMQGDWATAARGLLSSMAP